MRNEDKSVLRLNCIIMGFALNGSTDTDKGVTYNWKSAGHYLAVYIEDIDADATSYMLFYFKHAPRYERKAVLRPTYSTGDGCCIYDSKETAGSRKLNYCADGILVDGFSLAVKEDLTLQGKRMNLRE